MFCIKCGKKLPDDSIFCEYCGTKVEKLEETEEIEIIKEEEKKEEIVEKKVEEEKKQVIKSNEEIENSKEEKKEEKKEKETKKKEKNKDRVVDFSELDAAVADLKPDDLDDLIPKKSIKSIIISLLLIILIGVGLYFFLKSDKAPKILKEKKEDYQTIINEYAESIEKVTSEYLLENELIDDFSEISDKVKYDKHKVSCDNIYINIDGTVVLSDCTIDGKKVKETYGKKYNIQSKNDNDKCYVNHNEEDNKLEFNIDGEIASVYECDRHKCDLYKANEIEYNSCYDQIALIMDGSDIILYNYREAQNLLDPFSEVYAVKKGDKYQGFVALDSKSEKYGYVSTRGTVKIDFKYDSLGMIVNDTIYYKSLDVENDKIVAKKGNKYGVLKLSKGTEILPFDYDMIYISGDHYVVRKGDKFELIDKKKDKVIDKSYDMIFEFEDVIIVSENKKLKFIDKKGKKIIDDEIELFVDYKEEGANNIFGYTATKVNDIISIEVNKPSDSGGYDTIKYTYDIDEKKLTQKK